VNGVKYFECGEGCGSLVKPEKIAKGVSFMDAVNERYIDNTITLAEEDSYLMNSDGKRSKKIELVGMDKVGAMQSKIDVLRDVILKRSWIKSSSPDIGVQMPNIVHLDVSQNLIDSWDTVTDITRQLPLLEVLNVSHSRLADPSSPDKLKGAFPKLRSLVLNSCAISSWSKITFVDNHMPWLEEIFLCHNGITVLTEDSNLITGFQSLQLVNLEGNHLTEWKEIMKLSKLPLMNRIIVNDNQIPSIEPPTDASEFPWLKSLSITHNRISDWKSVDALNGYQRLDTLRFMTNPVLSQSSPSAGRNLVIARAGKLVHLNGSNIRAAERQEAEKYYLRTIINTKAPLEAHPRFNELVSIYGVPQEEKKEAQTLADEMINVTLTSNPHCQSIQKKIPLTLTVANLKILCNRLFKIDPNVQRLFYKADKSVPVPEFLDDNTRQLSYYSIVDNSEIIIEQ